MRMPTLTPDLIQNLRQALPREIEAELARRGLSIPQALAHREGPARSAFAQSLLQFRAGEIYPDEMLRRCEEQLGLKLPTEPVCSNHQAPGQYFLDSISSRDGGQPIVCACRSGGKTELTALIALIESVAYSDCGTRILGGSETQSLGLYEHLTEFIKHGDLYDLLDGEPLTTRVKFKNGSRARILAASQRSVRGPHVPRLILDEVDEIEPEIYRAALPILTSTSDIPGTLRILSTMNRPDGLMGQIMEEGVDAGRQFYTWCVFDVMERCEGRDCSKCVLWEDCQGKAQRANGYYKVDDAVKLRTAPGFCREDWESQMLCLKPGHKSLIWSGYNEQFHLYTPPADFDFREFRKTLRRVLAGVDWGYENPATIIVVGEDSRGRLWAIEEFYKAHILDEDLGEEAKLLHDKWGIEMFYCDPEDAGAIAKWRRPPLSLPVRRAKNAVEKGISAVASRFQLLPPHNLPRIYIFNSLTNLRREIKGYRRRGDGVRSSSLRGDKAKEDIIKKNDHGCDAFRYVIMAFDRPGYAGGY
jgi:hypothetical protein